MSKNTTPPEGYDVQREQMLDFKVPEQLVKVLDEDGRSDAKNFILTTVDEVFNWARLSSIWPVTFGLACCAIEMMASGGLPFRHRPLRGRCLPRHPPPGRPDDRRGNRDAKMASRLKLALRPDARSQVRHRHGQLRHRRRALFPSTATTWSRASTRVPVDVYVPGCPPRPEALLEGLMRLQDKIRGREGKLVKPKWISDYAKKIPYRK